MKNLSFIIRNESLKAEFTDMREFIGVANVSDIVLELCSDFFKNPYDLSYLMSNAEANFKTVNGVNGGKWFCVGIKGDKSYTVKLNEKATFEFTKISKIIGLKTGMLLSYLLDSYNLER